MLAYFYDRSGNVLTRTLESILLPHISGQPINQIAEPGDSAAFSVVITDSRGASFQWKLNGADIPGARADSLVVTDISAGMEDRQYSVVVTNSAGSVTSAAAAPMIDEDTDGLPDSWEIPIFGPPPPPVPPSATGQRPASQRSEGDPDRNGISNLDEFLDGTDPRSSTSLKPRLIAYSDAGGSVTVEPMTLSYRIPGSLLGPETVTLTAKPLSPSVLFVGWTGDLSDATFPTPLEMKLTMNANKTVRARFASVVPLPLGLVAFWRGETDASDLIGGHDGTFFAGASATVPSVTPAGKVGGSFSFDGTVHVRVPDSSALRPAEITLEAWIFPTIQLDSYQTIVARGFSATDDDTWFLGLRSGLPHFWTFPPDDVTGSTAIPVNEWTHLAATFDGTTKCLYVNGALVASRGGVRALVYDTTAVPVTIGSDWAVGASSALFSGRVDELTIYDRALTPNEIFDIYNADLAGKDLTQPYFTSPSRLLDVAVGAVFTQQITTILGMSPVIFSLSAGALPPDLTVSPTGLVSGTASTPGIFRFTVRATDAAGAVAEQFCILQVFESVVAPAGLVGWWRAEGDALDSAGSNHGALRNGAGFAAGKVGQAFSFHGENDFFEIPDATALHVTSVTKEAWVEFDVTSGIRMLFAKPLGATTGDSYALWLNSGILNGAVGGAAAENGPALSAPFSPVPGRWYHLAYTFDNGANQQALYVDGSQIAIGAVTLSLGYDAQPLLFGRDTESGVPNFFFQGRIDEAAIYNRALSAVEIASIYNAGPAGKRR
jgi:hypothetical protein